MRFHQPAIGDCRLAFAFLLGSALLLGCGARLRAQESTEWRLSSAVTVTFSQFGGIRSVESGEGQLLGPSQLATTVLLGSQDRVTLFQGWGCVAGNAAEVSERAEEVAVTGVLGGEKIPDAPRQIQFTQTYRKVAEGAFVLRVEIEFLADVTASEPVTYWLRFPVAAFRGGNCLLVDAGGIEKAYPLGDEVLPLKGDIVRHATFTTGAWRATIEPDDDAVLFAFDSRAWGDEAAVILKLTSRQPWSTPFSYPAGTKQSFEAKVAFEKGN